MTSRDPRVNDPLILSTPVVNLEPSVGEPAKFGFQTAVGPVILDTSIRTGGDYGVTVTVSNIVNIPFLGSQVTLWGVPADPRHDGQRTAACIEDTGPKIFSEGNEFTCPANEQEHPFLIMPTACDGPLHSTVESDSWSSQGVFESGEYTFQTGPGGNGGEPFAIDGCNHLSFEPSISVSPDGQQASTPTGLTVDVHVPQEASLNPVGLADAAVKDTTVALPVGVGLNPAGADGLSACGLGEIALEIRRNRRVRNRRRSRPSKSIRRCCRTRWSVRRIWRRPRRWGKRG